MEKFIVTSNLGSFVKAVKLTRTDGSSFISNIFSSSSDRAKIFTDIIEANKIAARLIEGNLNNVKVICAAEIEEQKSIFC